MFQRVLFIPVIVLLVAVVAWGCTDTKDLEDRLAVVEQQQASVSDQLQSISDATQRSAMLTALTILDGAELHVIDDAAGAGEVDAGASAGVDSAIVAMSAVDWPDELKPDADALVADLQALLTALDSADAAIVADPARTAHEAYHPFEHDAANYLRSAVGLETEASDEDMSNMADATASPPEGG